MQKLKIPKELKDRLRSNDKEECKKAIDDLAAAADALVRARHGSGGRGYRDQHFMFTYSGTMYEEFDKESDRMEKATFGTAANRNLKTVVDDLRSRLSRILIDKETPRTLGAPSKYGFFADAISEISLMTMEIPEDFEMDRGQSAEGVYEGSREIDDDPYLDFRIGTTLFTMPAEEADLKGKPKLGESYKIKYDGRHYKIR